MKLFLLIFLFSSSVLAQSQFRYEGYLENGGTPVGPLTGQTFEVRLKKPGCASFLGLPVFVDNNVSIQNGEFNLVPQFDEALLSVAMDPNETFGCTVGSARDLEITWVDQSRTFIVAMQDAPRASFSNLANNSKSLSGRTQQEFLKIDNYVSQTPLTNAQVNSLVSLVNGTSTLFSTPASPLGGDLAGSIAAATVQGIRGRPVAAGAATPATGQILKYDGANWTPAADDVGTAPGNASYAARGLVQIDTSAAISGLNVAAGVVRIAPSGVTAGSYGNLSTVPAITVDAMGRITTATNTPIGIAANQVTAGTLSVNRGGTGSAIFTANGIIIASSDGSSLLSRNCTAGEILKSDGAAWNCSPDGGAGGSIAVTPPIQSTGGGSPTISLNVGLGANQVPRVGGTALMANGLVLANNLGNALTSLNCTIGQTVKFNASGFAVCADDETGILSLNGQIGSNHTLAIGNSGPAPNIASAVNIHTLNIPLASTAGVTSGTISNVDYVNFSNKPEFRRTGVLNLFLGTSAGQSTSTGARNTSVGEQTFRSLTIGNDNTALGFEAGFNLTSSTRNTLIGSGAGQSLVNTSSGNNTFVGFSAGRNFTTGLNNTFIGYRAGEARTNGDSNVFIGSNDGAALGLINNSVVLSDGDGDVKIFADFQGRVGIGTTNPAGLLHTKSDGTNELYVDNYDNAQTTSSFFVSRRSRGSTLAGSSVQMGDRLGGWGAVGHDGNASAITNIITAGIFATAAENFSLVNRGTHLSLFTTPNGNNTRVERVKILENGNVGIGTNTPGATLDVNGTVRVGTGAVISRIVRCSGSPTIITVAVSPNTSRTLSFACPGITPGSISQCAFTTQVDDQNNASVMINGLVSSAADVARFRIFNFNTAPINIGETFNVTCFAIVTP